MPVKARGPIRSGRHGFVAGMIDGGDHRLPVGGCLGLDHGRPLARAPRRPRRTPGSRLRASWTAVTQPSHPMPSIRNLTVSVAIAVTPRLCDGEVTACRGCGQGFARGRRRCRLGRGTVWRSAMSAGGDRAGSRGRMIDARAYWAVAPGAGEVRTERMPPPSTGEVLVRALWSGVSRGTEALVGLGRVPPSQWAAMRAPFQAGDFPFPVKYGYSSVGVVEEGPAELVGRSVFCLLPAPDPLCRPGVRGGAPAARAAAGARGAGREHGDGAQRGLGRRGSAGAAHPCHRRRRGRRHDRLSLRPAARRRGDARGHRPRPVRARRGTWAWHSPRPTPWPGTPIWSCTRAAARRACARPWRWPGPRRVSSR